MRRCLAFLVALTLTLAVNAAWSGEVTILVAHGATEEHSAHQSWLVFKKFVEDESKGMMKVELYPNQQMGGDREVAEGVQLGNIHAGHSSLSPIASFAKEFSIWDMPFAFTTREQIYGLLDGEPGQKLTSYLEPIHLKGLGYLENGFRNLTANKKVLSPDDLKGVKMRVMENKIQMLTWSTLGANPTPIAFGELFTALQQGTVDAQENPYELIYTNKFYEVQKFVMSTNHIYSPLIMFMNLDFYNSLAPEQQAVVMKASREAIAHNRQLAKENEQKSLEVIKKGSTFVDLTPEQREAFRAKMNPVYAEIRKQVNNDALVDMFLQK